MMVIFLTGLVSMILLRTLRADYARYTRDDDDLEALERDMSEESGWKLVHGDVFRPPRNLELLAALIGTGVQLALLILSTILITIAGACSLSPALPQCQGGEQHDLATHLHVASISHAKGSGHAFQRAEFESCRCTCCGPLPC